MAKLTDKYFSGLCPFIMMKLFQGVISSDLESMLTIANSNKKTLIQGIYITHSVSVKEKTQALMHRFT